jgi:aspartate 4-decarboxylase
VELPVDPNRTAYYQTLDLENWARRNIGQDFIDYIAANNDPLDVVIAMARRGDVLLNGDGFDAPKWSVRVSLANLDDAAYPRIGSDLRALVLEAIERWKKSRG